MSKIKIAITDDYEVFREGVKAILENDEHIEILFEANNGKELLEKLEIALPDIIIMDLKMPVMDGIEATPLVKKKYPAIKVLVVTMYEDEKFIRRLMEAGASGYLLKNAEPAEIKKAIYSIYESGSILQ